MSNIILPFLFKSNILSRHHISKILPILPNGKIVTSSRTGELVIWNSDNANNNNYIDAKYNNNKQNITQLTPSLFLVPCLNQNVGMLTAMTLMDMLEPELMCCSKICLVTVHSDNRLRLWDTRDGRCYSISSSGLFPNEEIREIRPLFYSRQRFIVALGYSQNLYIVDLWKMKVCKVLSTGTSPISAFTIFNEAHLIAINSKDEIYKWDIQDLASPYIIKYEKYAINVNESNKILQDLQYTLKVKSCLPKNIMSCFEAFIPEKQRLLQIKLLYDYPLAILVYTNRIVILERDDIYKNENQRQPFLHIMIQETTIFTNIHLMLHEQEKYLLVKEKEGNIFSVSLNDLYYLWKIFLSAKYEDEIEIINENFKLIKKREFEYGSIELAPIYIVHRTFQNEGAFGSTKNKLNEDEEAEDIIDFEHNVIAIDYTTRDIVYYDKKQDKISFYDLIQEYYNNPDKYKFVKFDIFKQIGINDEPKNNNPLLYDESHINPKVDPDSLFNLKAYFSFELSQKNKPLNFSDLMHPRILSQFNYDFDSILQEGEYITVSTIAYHKDVEPLYIFGTNKGRVLLFKLLFTITQKKYYYYTFQFDENEINILHVNKNLLFVSCSRGKFGVYSISIKDLAKVHSKIPEISGDVASLDISTFCEFESMLVAPLKRVLKIKLLSIDDDSNNEYTPEQLRQYKSKLALILKNNSVICFSYDKKKIEFECKSNETSVLGVFIHPLLDYLIILNANGNINIFSTFTGRFERSISIKDYSHLLNLKELINEYSNNYNDLHKFKNYIEDNRNYISQIHGILEFNSRQIRNFLNYLNDNQLNPNKRYELIWERLGNVKQINYSLNDSPHLIWLMKYSHELIYSSKYKKYGAAFLNLYLDTSVTNLEKRSSISHILLIDCKKSIQSRLYRQKDPDDQKSNTSGQSNNINTEDLQIKLKPRLSVNSFENVNSHLNFLPFIHAWGLDPHLDDDIRRISFNKCPVFSYYYGLQGLGESFSFVLTERENLLKDNINSNEEKKIINVTQRKIDGQQDSGDINGLNLNSTKNSNILSNRNDLNWQTSPYLTTIHAMGYMIYYAIQSHSEFESGITSQMRNIIEFLEEKYSKIVKNYCKIDIYLTSFLATFDDSDVVSAACNLLQIILPNQNPQEHEPLIGKMFEYLKVSIQSSEQIQRFPFAKFETNMLSLLSLSMCHGTFFKNNKNMIFNITEYCLKHILGVIDIRNCFNNPSAVSCCMKLLVDGIGTYKNYIKKIDELFFNITVINYHYTCSLDESLRPGREIINLNYTKFENVHEKLSKQPLYIKQLIKQTSLRVLLALGEHYQSNFVTFFIKEAKNISFNINYPAIIIEIIRNFIKRNSRKCLSELPRLTDSILYCLDPNNPILRKSCHKYATRALQTIFKTFPQSSFHQGTQKFAIGTQDNKIIIYDLRTACRWKEMEGHNAPVNAISFSSTGELIASYSHAEKALLIWKIGGFIAVVTSVMGKNIKPRTIINVFVDNMPNMKIDDLGFKLQWQNNDKAIGLVINDSLYLTFDPNKGK